MSKNQPPRVDYVPKQQARILRHQRALPLTRAQAIELIRNWRIQKEGPAIIAAAIAVGIGITYPEGKGPAR